MRIFATKWFSRYAKRERINNRDLRDAVERAEAGLIDAELGGGLIKQRIARRGAGRSGGYRTLLAFRAGGITIFLFGFAKSDKENLTDDELRTLKEIAGKWLASDDETIEDAVALSKLLELKNGS